VKRALVAGKKKGWVVMFFFFFIKCLKWSLKFLYCVRAGVLLLRWIAGRAGTRVEKLKLVRTTW
jgi:hypothetical protein